MKTQVINVLAFLGAWIISMSPSANEGKCPRLEEKEKSMPVAPEDRKAFDDLKEEEKAFYYLLLPHYQKIYLYAFNSEERHRSVVYLRKGLNPYQAMNVILKTEEKKYNEMHKENVTPKDRMGSPNRECEILQNFHETID